VTCAHVIGEDGAPGTVVIYYQGKSYDASVVKLIPPTPPDEESFPDIAILAADGISNHPYVYLNPQYSSRQLVYTYGYTGRMKFGESFNASVDGIANQDDEAKQQLIKFTRVQVVGGLSGAPLLNEDTGAVCGMVNRTFDAKADLGGLAVPAERILASLNVERIRNDDRVWRSVGRDTPGLAETGRLFVVPRGSDVFFVGRESLFADLTRALERDRRVGLVGLGGVGKTQAAVQYAYRHRGEYQAVLWLAADDADTLVKSFIALAKPLGVLHAATADVNEIVVAVRRWLETHDDWLLIVDNADTPSAAAPYLPSGQAGRVIVTSRRRDLAALNVRSILDVWPLSSEEATSFLLRRAYRKDDAERADARCVATLLGDLPLALEQAGAHVLASGTTFAEYAEALRRGGLTALDDGRAQPDSRKTVATTWRFAFDELEDVPVACDLLRLAAFLSPEDIPLTLFEGGGPPASRAIEQAMSTQDPAVVLSQMLEPLVDYSLVSRDIVRRSFAVHGLVQQVLRERLSAKDRAYWTQRAVDVVLFALPEPDFRGRSIYNRLLPHVQALSARIAQYGVASASAATMLDQAGSYLFNRVRLNDALPLFEQSLAIRERLFGSSDPAVAQSLTHVANVHRDLSRYDEAAALYRRALAIRRRRLPRSAALSSTLVNVANLNADLGKYAQAERQYREALDIRRKLRPRDELRLAEVMNNLALLLDSKGAFAEALRLHNAALAIRRAHRRQEPLEYAESLNNIGRHFVEREMYGRAGPYFDEALAISQKYLDPDHPDLVATTYNKALVLDAAGEDRKAEELYRWSIEAWKTWLGPRHPDLALPYNSLAALYEKTGRIAQAKAAYREALALITHGLGPRHPDAALVRSNLRALGAGTKRRFAKKQSRAVGVRARKKSAAKWVRKKNTRGAARRGSPRAR